MKKDYIFISYSSKRQDIADAFYNVLENEKIDVWMAPNDIPIGQKYANVIMDAISNCAGVAVLITKESQASYWCSQEISDAIECRKPIIPIWITNEASDEAEIKTKKRKYDGGFELLISIIQSKDLDEKNIDASNPQMQEILRSIRECAYAPVQVNDEQARHIASGGFGYSEATSPKRSLKSKAAGMLFYICLIIATLTALALSVDCSLIISYVAIITALVFMIRLYRASRYLMDFKIVPLLIISYALQVAAVVFAVRAEEKVEFGFLIALMLLSINFVYIITKRKKISIEKFSGWLVSLPSIFCALFIDTLKFSAHLEPLFVVMIILTILSTVAAAIYATIPKGMKSAVASVLVMLVLCFLNGGGFEFLQGFADASALPTILCAVNAAIVLATHIILIYRMKKNFII